jgi:heme/copper-type cytochrome/quinol oxidase subunit 2
VLRRLLMGVITAVSLGWIVVSYLPGVRALLPVWGWPLSARWMGWAAVVMLIVFVLIQLRLVQTTLAAVRSYDLAEHCASYRLKRGTELFWTALPIAMTLGLAWASLGLVRP